MALAGSGMKIAVSDLPFGWCGSIDVSADHLFLRHGKVAEPYPFTTRLGFGKELPPPLRHRFA
ncbi:hypothetical protein [Rhizobium tropici]|uniref:Uncharacterized protein n=1 Tax=Rhizobium tropici TaxID=398 RepID=A0A329YIX2_RHITR|nr:hypothetical protein [Rhizobium tropici]RAX42988.1 hypothetical protein DQ393_04245 [Rhizobium tropici]